MLVVLLGIVMILSMPTDIFPVVDIPVISVAFNYVGMSPDDMDKRIVTPFERILTTTVNDIEHIESQSLYGIGVVKIYFQKNANIENANAQVTAIGQTAIRQMPPGTQPPLIIEYNASNVPILQLSLSSDTLPEQSMFDLAINTMRPEGSSRSPGVQIPHPSAGKQRIGMVDIDPEKALRLRGFPLADVSNAINAQNLDSARRDRKKLGRRNTSSRKLNSSPEVVTTLNEMPIKTVNGATVYIKDVANVRDGYSVQTNVVHSNGNAAAC